MLSTSNANQSSARKSNSTLAGKPPCDGSGDGEIDEGCEFEGDGEGEGEGEGDGEGEGEGEGEGDGEGDGELLHGCRAIVAVAGGFTWTSVELPPWSS